MNSRAAGSSAALYRAGFLPRLVNDSIALRRRWRNLGALTTVRVSVQTNTAQSAPSKMAPVAYCESMCVFLLLSGKTRYVPETAHVRVHQIWMATANRWPDCRGITAGFRARKP
jgi:hypothetical protein